MPGGPGGVGAPAGLGEPLALPPFVGQRIESALELGSRMGWTVHVTPVDPRMDDQPDGLVVSQKPMPGAPLAPGSVVLLDVVRRRSWMQRNQTGVLGALAALFALLALVFGVVALSSDDDGGEADGPTQEELDASNARIAQLEAQLAAAEGGDDELATTLQAQVDELNGQVATLQGQVDQLTADLEAANAALATATSERDQAVADLATVTAERDQAVADLATVTAERDAALQQVAELQAQLGGIQDSVTAMPSFVGSQLVAVEDFAEETSVELKVEEVDTATGPVAAGTVIEQLPAAGVPLVDGSVIWVQVYNPAP
jgi:septal ring factor EnvC (AmiA/AmiB activator)